MTGFAARLLVVLLMVLWSGCQADRHSPEPPTDSDVQVASRDEASSTRLTGRVQLEGAPDHSGIQVYVPGTSLVAFTDERGRFTMSIDRPSTTVQLVARIAGFQPDTVFRASPSDLSATSSIRLERVITLQRQPRETAPFPALAGVDLHGRFRIPDQISTSTLSFRECAIWIEGTPYRTIAQDDGTFLLWNLPPGSYELRVRMPGFVPVRRSVHLGAEESRHRLQIDLEPTGTDPLERIVTGRVRFAGTESATTPAFNRVRIRVTGHPEFTTIPEADGSFRLAGLPAEPVTLEARAEGFSTAFSPTIDMSRRTRATLELVLKAAPQGKPYASLRGEVIKNITDLDDSSGVRVALVGSTISATTDAMGRFIMNDIPPGSYVVLAQAEGFEDARRGPVELQAGQQYELQGILLEPIRDHPRVLATDPPDGTRNVLIRRQVPVTIRFSKQMDPASLEDAIRVRPSISYRLLTGRSAPELDADQVRLLLVGGRGPRPLQFETTYRIQIAETAVDFEGVPLEEPFSMRLTTGGPAVIGTDPPDSGMMDSGSPSNPVTIFFNAPIESRSVTLDAFLIRPREPINPNLALFTDPATGWSHLNLTKFWQPGMRYRITLRNRIRTRDNDRLDNVPYEFIFQTPQWREYPIPLVPEAR